MSKTKMKAKDVHCFLKSSTPVLASLLTCILTMLTAVTNATVNHRIL